MERRSLLALGSVVLPGSTAGCRSLFTVSTIDPEKVNFTEREGQHLLVIRNNRSQSVQVTVTTTGEHTNVDYSDSLELNAGESVEITELFTRGNESYTFRLVTENHEIERTIQMGGLYDKSVFEIRTDEIEYRQSRRRTPDIVVSNQLDTAAEFTITVVPQSSDDPPVYDTFELPSGGFASFTDIFSIGTDYDVTVEANGMTSSESHGASSTNSVWVTVDGDGLRVGEAEE